MSMLDAAQLAIEEFQHLSDDEVVEALEQSNGAISYAFSQGDIPGSLRSVSNVEEVKQIANESGRKFKECFER